MVRRVINMSHNQCVVEEHLRSSGKFPIHRNHSSCHFGLFRNQLKKQLQMIFGFGSALKAGTAPRYYRKISSWQCGFHKRKLIPTYNQPEKVGTGLESGRQSLD